MVDSLLPEPLDFAARETPLQPADRLATALGLEPGRLFVKRDDLTGLAGGGNKARKLEYLVGSALAAGADTLVTTGAAQSNHVRATGAAARAAGLECVAVLSERDPKTVPEGNLVLDDLLGIRVVWTTYSKQMAKIASTLQQLEAEGRVPFNIPLGGSSAVGAAAYAHCADEVETALPGSTVFCANGSGGTHAGLVAGFGTHERVIGFDVAGFKGLDEAIATTANEAARLLGRPAPDGVVQLDHSQSKAPYGEPTDDMYAALRLTAETEGLILDPVYSGRGMAGLIALAERGELPSGPLVFLHTGGMPALFTERYRSSMTINPYRPPSSPSPPERENGEH